MLPREDRSQSYTPTSDIHPKRGLGAYRMLPDDLMKAGMSKQQPPDIGIDPPSLPTDKTTLRICLE